VEINVSTIAVRTSRSRLPILGSDGISVLWDYQAFSQLNISR
jgi:hypothetical protein